jgi:hypothetical protein
MNKSWVEGSKALRFTGFKRSPTTASDEQLAAINKFTRRPFKAEELYIGQMRLANNAIDRDNERFSEQILQDFARTIVRKTQLMDHDKWESRKSAIGKFFDCEIETMPVEQAQAETGEEFRLPEGVSQVMFISPWFYIPIEGTPKEDIVKIDAGIFEYTSIGFRAASLSPVTDTQTGQTLYYEYRGKGEATEGSLVYLGSQYGARVKSPGTEGAGDTSHNFDSHENLEGGKHTMNEFLKRLLRTLGKSFSEGMTEDQAVAAVKSLVDEKDTEIKRLAGEVSARDEKISGLTPLAADGKAFREELVTQYVSQKAKLGDVAETPEAQTAVKTVASSYPIQFLKDEVKCLDKRVAEKFPDTPNLPGDTRTDKSKDGTKGEKAWQEENPLVPKD